MKRLIPFLFSVLFFTFWFAIPADFSSFHPHHDSTRQGSSTTYYVRPDGGMAEQCTGLTDTPYPGSGMGLACAWSHPFVALPPMGEARIVGGDTLNIASGDYAMGFGAPSAELCEEAGSFDCLMPPVPSGRSPQQPTRILGAGWDSDCPVPPELWGTGRPWFVLNLTDASNVEIACLEITDHSDCVEAHTGGLACERDRPPYGDWAAYGLYAEDSANVHLSHLNIHGLASGGIHAGRLTNWTLDDVRIAGNGTVGWDGDLWDELGDANTGTLTFRRLLVEWNGCGETYPAGEPTGCWGQEAGGYGDGMGTGDTGGNWIFEDSAFLHNTSDGLDLLYHVGGGTVTLNRMRAEGNAGNQVKIAGEAAITNTVLVGNCAFFVDQPFTYWVDHCRALGSALLVAYTGGEQVSLVNSTVYGQGDGLLGAGPREGYPCDGTESFRVRNSIFVGDSDYFDPSDSAYFFYQEGCNGLHADSDYNIFFSVKNVECSVDGDFTQSGSHDLCEDPLLAGPLSGAAYGMALQPASPAVDTGDNAKCTADDLAGHPRPEAGSSGSAICDRGAYEWAAS
ncbi:MAG: right-handed parallel beta-helix repeat-containing protein [Anaerolineae bacterium]|nr:right-handed parallel beta-helix repeat-containing protein [Anaerolineae bacterium]